MADKITKVKRTNNLGIKIALNKKKCAGVEDITIDSNRYTDENGDTIIDIIILGGLDPIEVTMSCDDPECGAHSESGAVTLTKIDDRHYIITVPQYTDIKAVSFIAYDKCGHVETVTEGFGSGSPCDSPDYNPPAICITCIEKSYE